MGTRIDADEFVEFLSFDYPNKEKFTKKEIIDMCKNHNVSIPTHILKNCCINPGKRPLIYSLELIKGTSVKTVNTITENNIKATTIAPIANETAVKTIDYNTYIPATNDYYVSCGTNSKIINEIVSTAVFFPMYIYGVSGLGKTFQIEQACAKFKRPFFRCQITKDTTNEELVGSYSLVNGNTVWIDGPVLMAYRSGGILLLDEIDLNSSLMFLQVVLENKPIYVPQTGELVYPKNGFNVFATGNSKGDGSDARYVGTTVLNDAFLERFVTIIEQKIPTLASEKKIIERYMKIEKMTLEDNLYNDFCRWIDVVRASFTEGNTEVYISTRRIQYILKCYKLINNFSKAIEMALARYSDEDTDAFMKTWKAIHIENTNE